MFKVIQYSNLLRCCVLKPGTKRSTISDLNILFLKCDMLLRNYVTVANNMQDTNIGSNINESSDVQAIISGNPELEQKFKVILLETEVMRQDGNNVPSNTFLKKAHWEELLQLPTRTARTRYLKFLFKLEKRKEHDMIKKQEKRLERERNPKPEIPSDGHLVYSLTQNNMFLRFYDTTINHLFNQKLIEAKMFGQQLVVDCGYDKNMTSRENINCAKQLMLLFADNRAHDDPYDLHFCNVDKNSVLINTLHKHINTMYEPWFPLSLHENSYCDIFPKEKLIYLTPHAREEMLEYDHDAIYIIGGLVDKTNNDPLSLAKAKKEEIKMLKLPLDRYLLWGSGSGKSLTLNHVVSVLLDIKKSGDWSYALRHVPRRKILNVEESCPNISNAKTLPYDKEDSHKVFQLKPKHFNRRLMNNPSNNNTKRFQIKNILSK